MAPRIHVLLWTELHVAAVRPNHQNALVADALGHDGRKTQSQLGTNHCERNAGRAARCLDDFRVASKNAGSPRFGQNISGNPIFVEPLGFKNSSLHQIGGESLSSETHASGVGATCRKNSLLANGLIEVIIRRSVLSACDTSTPSSRPASRWLTRAAYSAALAAE